MGIGDKNFDSNFDSKFDSNLCVSGRTALYLHVPF